MGPAHVENVADLACRTALAYRGVAHINFPVDIQEQDGRRRALQAQRAGPHVGRVRPRSARPAGRGRSAPRGRRCSTPARRSRSSPARARCGAARRAGAGRRDARRADRQGAARQGGGARRQPVHHGRHRPAGHAALAGGAGGVRHAADGRHVVSRTSSSCPKPGQARGRADRPRPDADRAALSRSKSAWSATPAHARRRCCRCSSAKRTAASSRRPRSGMTEWWELMEERGTRTDMPMKPQVVAWELGNDGCADDAIVACDSRHDHHLVPRGTSRSRRGQMFSLLGQPGHDGARPALRDRRADRLSRTASSSRSSATAGSRC